MRDKQIAAMYKEVYEAIEALYDAYVAELKKKYIQSEDK